ncbi:MAG: 3-isopropylmalate/(R)-2-methylmalate dehydratase small subunit [Actinomycetota bacterium]|jgi:3-isopropylmalate/(R)-2-methylmalate dehydratase small subunit|nr:3-isopropylmalate/(R)-2-methylmalate dehydratase small subunit [Actinomycetota bacterium]
MEAINVIEGEIAVLDRSDVDTDQIIPKQFLKRVERTGYGEFLFYDWVRDGEIVLEPHPILVSGRNFGSGSSREHAVWALHQFGFKAVIAPSFSDIFYSNSTKNGFLPVELSEDVCQALVEAGEAKIDLENQMVSWAGGEASFEIEAEIKRRLIGGLDDIALTLMDEEEIEAFESGPGGTYGPVTTSL